MSTALVAQCVLYSEPIFLGRVMHELVMVVGVRDAVFRTRHRLIVRLR